MTGGVDLHRAAGVLLGTAAGDALGAGYEFGPSLSDDADVSMIGGGAFGWAPGEWTDDTSMALVIAEAAAEGADLRGTGCLDRIAAGWLDWTRDARDVGVQTRSVLDEAGRRTGGRPTAEIATAVAAEHHQYTGRSGGNGSLMRTAPVALAYLDDEAGMAEAARTISALTHFDPEAGDACVLWCAAIRLAVLTGDLDVRAGLRLLPAERRDVWRQRIEEAEAYHPADFHRNGWVVQAFQAAWCAIVTTQTGGPEQLRRALEAAVRGGGDTDTVAAIAGGLLGAAHGASAVPAEWRRRLHGWPGLRGRDLIGLAVRIASRGEVPADQWPLVGRMDYTSWGDISALAEHWSDSGVLLGGVGRLDPLPEGVDAVVSLCRLGAHQVPTGSVAPENHIEVWLVDSDDPAANPHLEFVMADTVGLIAQLRREGRTVLVHCVQAKSRTPAVAVLYAIARGEATHQAFDGMRRALPDARPNAAFTAMIARAGSA